MVLNKTKSWLIIIVLLVSTITVAQKRTYLTVYNSFEKMNNNNAQNSFGASVERKFSTNYGFEIGCNAKNIIYVAQNVKMQYASIPLKFKYYSNIVNISLGAEANYYMGWDFISELVIPSTVSHDIFKLTYSGIISKDINLTSKLTLEPQISVNLFNPINSDYLNLGGGLKLKYQL